MDREALVNVLVKLRSGVGLTERRVGDFPELKTHFGVDTDADVVEALVLAINRIPERSTRELTLAAYMPQERDGKALNLTERLKAHGREIQYSYETVKLRLYESTPQLADAILKAVIGEVLEDEPQEAEAEETIEMETQRLYGFWMKLVKSTYVDLRVLRMVELLPDGTLNEWDPFDLHKDPWKGTWARRSHQGHDIVELINGEWEGVLVRINDNYFQGIETDAGTRASGAEHSAELIMMRVDVTGLVE